MNTNIINTKLQYNFLSQTYSGIVMSDPSKVYVQYPSALKLIGDVKNKKVVDIGCGEGIFSRILSREGAKVVGFDISEKQIDEAGRNERKEGLGINYFVADMENFVYTEKFDKAVSIMALPYLSDKKKLDKFFSRAHNLLNKNADFVAIVFNPKFKRFGQEVYNRIFKKAGDKKIKVFFHGPIKSSFPATFSDFSADDYEVAAKKAGFSQVHWKKLKINENGIKKVGKNFWKDFENDCPYIGLEIKK
jgi:cyclopropane fatty-acyl-phospholipid synthase-like methyltransferase